MKLKAITAALAAAAIIQPAAYAAEEAIYICAYYDDSGALLNTRAVDEGELENVSGSFVPDGAVRAKLFRWDDALLPAGELSVSDHTQVDAAALQNISATAKAPNVTSEMCAASFWQQKDSCSDEVIMTADEIDEFNQKILETADTHMNDLTAFEGTYDGVSLAKLYSDFKSPENLYLNGDPVPESYYKAIRDNIRNAPVSKAMPYKFGFAVNRTIIKEYPYEDYLSDDPSDPEWDELVSTGVSVNEPLVILFATADGKFTFVYSQYYSGWAPTEDFAVCKSREEWEGFLNPEDFIVVTGEKVYLEPSADKDLNEKLLTMGTVLPLDTEYTDGAVAHRLPWNNYAVKIPARSEDGKFYQKSALISANRDVNAGYLPYTSANVLTQAFKSLGNRYGWGGMLNSQDCSAFAQDVYKCFGFKLARNSSWQAAMPADVTDMSQMTDDEKKAVLDALPAGAILLMPGHEVLYLGSENGLYYVINDSGSFVSPDNPDIIMKPKSIIINDLSALRKDGKTWLTSLNRAVVIR